MTSAIATEKTDIILAIKERNKGSAFDLLPLPYVAARGASLPRRDFLCGPAFQSRHMTLTVAPAGVGKTSLTIAEAVHMAAGHTLFSPISAPMKVWLFNGETYLGRDCEIPDARDLTKTLAIACGYAMMFGVALAERASARQRKAAA